ncbi:MAG: membrane protein [Aquirhabdus sp.]
MLSSVWQILVGRLNDVLSGEHFWVYVTIAPVAAIVTWMHVWMALNMMFYPIKFFGIRLGPIPLGWQGIVPRKAGKISGIIVDQTLSKLWSLQEFFHAMDPAEMAKMIGDDIAEELEYLIDEVMLDRNPTLWENLPFSVKRRIYQQAHKQMPTVMHDIVTELTFNVENLVDMREMIVRKMENDRLLMVQMFLKVGQKEINFIWHISALIGLVFGLFQMVIFLVVPWHWTIVFWAALWGFLTNWIAIWMVFNPIEPINIRFPQFFRFSKQFPFILPTLPKIGTLPWQGAFMRRQPEVSAVFAEVVTQDLITVKSIMSEMMYGTRANKTRRILKRHINLVMETPLLRTVLQMSIGPTEYAKLKSDMIDKSIEATMKPVSSASLNKSRGKKIYEIFHPGLRFIILRNSSSCPSWGRCRWGRSATHRRV